MAIIAKIRKHAGLAVGLIGIAIVGFVVQDAFGGRGQQAPPVAVINGEILSYDRFSAQVDQLTEQYKMAQGADMRITEEDLEQIRSLAWQRILGDYLLNEACAKAGLAVSPEELNDMYYGEFISPYLYQYFTNPQTGQYDRQQVMNLINNFSQLSPQDQAALLDLERIIKNERLKEKYYNLATRSYYMPKAMAAHILATQSDSYTARYVSYPFTEIPDDEVRIGKADFQKYYNENKYMFRQNKSRTLDYVVFDVTPTPQDMADLDKQVNELYAEFLEEANVPDFVNAVTSGERFDSLYLTRSEILPGWDTLFEAEAGTYFAPRRVGKTYQMAKLMDAQMRPDSLHVRYIFLSYAEAGSQSGRNKEQSRHLADSLTTVIGNNPALFSQIAGQYSEDPSVMQNGGDMGWLKEGSFIGFLNKAILSTPEGEAVMVEGPNGFHIFYVEGKTRPVKKVLAAIVTIPIEPSAATTKSVFTQANQLLGQAGGSVALLDSAASKMGMRVRQASVTGMESALPGVNQAREVIRWAYNKDSKEGEVASQVFEMENRYVIAGLRAINETEYMSIERAMEIPQVEFMVRQDKKFAQAAQKLAASNNIEELSASLSLKIDTAANINMASYPMLANGSFEPAVIGTICGLEQGGFSKPVKGNMGAYRVLLEQATEGKASAQQVEQYCRQQEMQFLQSAANYVGSALEKAATIEDNRGFYF